MNVDERILELRRHMEEKDIDIYVVPTADFHQSEYVGEYFKARKFITGFTGSAGTAVITRRESRLWTDGRYFIQAAKELADSHVELMKMGHPDTPTIEEYLEEALPEGGAIGFDGRTVSMGEGCRYEAIARKKKGRIIFRYDLINRVWKDRPALSEEPAFALEEKYTGESTASKLKRIRLAMKGRGATMHLLTTLDDICWTLNIRGNDIEFFPLVLSYAIISMNYMHLYIDEKKLSDKLKDKLERDGVVLHSYNAIYMDVCGLSSEDRLMIDPDRLNYALYQSIPEDVVRIEERNPEILFKAVKNPVEIDNIRNAQIKDSVAHVRFMKWLKENVGKSRITEMSASEKLDEFRKEMGNYIQPSFEPICSFGEHAAIVHYSSSPKTDVELKKGHLFLTDTGAGFYEGSTDITRTYALGKVPQIMKDHFTIVAISNLQLANTRFRKGCSGMNLDIIARKPFWDRGLDYNHGTGHGVGYLLNIHEGPASFRWQYRAGDTQPFEAGMIITDEPGLYIEGSHGIRIENELLVRQGEENEYGQFMYFEPLTYVPIDLDAINPELMSREERKMLNKYHKAVYKKVSPYLSSKEKEWLGKYTREI